MNYLHNSRKITLQLGVSFYQARLQIAIIVYHVRHICLHVYLHGGTRLPLGECSSNLV
jgi:hypothetical protein